MKTWIFFSLMLTGMFVSAQTFFTPSQIEPEGDYENVQVKEIYSDSLNSSFIIWVKKQVKAHRHAEHTEAIYVVSGSGDMKVGDETFSIVAGDYFVIPKNTAHSVVVTSRDPLKIISIQSPKFDGKDRIWIE